LTLVLWLPFAIAIVVLIHSIRIGAPQLSALPEIVAGLFVGGGLANVLEAQMIGSVTDFLGIHGMGTYSAGDIAFDVASSLLPIAVIQIARAQHQTFTHVLQAGAVFYGAVVLVAVASQDYAHGTRHGSDRRRCGDLADQADDLTPNPFALRPPVSLKS